MIKSQSRVAVLMCFLCVWGAGAEIIGTPEQKEKEPSAIDVVARTVLYLEFDQQASEVKLLGGGKIAELDLYYKLPGSGVYFPKRITVGGTGFLVQSKTTTYVATAKHVVKNSKSVGRFWINPVGSKIISGSFAEIRTRLMGAKWFFHEHSDIAIHPIVFPVHDKTFNVWPAEKIPRMPTELLSPVCVPGFPHSLGKDNIKLGPLLTACEITSWPAILPGKEPQAKVVFLSKRLTHGYSGAPVVTSGDPPSRGQFTKHTMNLVGILSGHKLFKNEEPTKRGTITTQDEYSYMVPVSYLIELLESEAVQKFEKDRLTQAKPPQPEGETPVGKETE